MDTVIKIRSRIGLAEQWTKKILTARSGQELSNVWFGVWLMWTMSSTDIKKIEAFETWLCRRKVRSAGQQVLTKV